MDKRWRAAHDKSGAGTTHAKTGERSVLGAGTSGWLDSSVGRRWGGLGTTARARRQCGELDWGISRRSGSPSRALSSGGGSAEELANTSWEEWRVAPVFELVGTRASCWSSRMEWWHWTRTQGGRRREALRRRQNPTALKGSLGTAAICGKEKVSGGPEHSAVQTASHRHGWGDDSVETVSSARTGPVGMVGPLKARNFAEFGWRMVSTCPAPSNRWAQHRPRRHW
jgi:hypothetical protein